MPTGNSTWTTEAPSRHATRAKRRVRIGTLVATASAMLHIVAVGAVALSTTSGEPERQPAMDDNLREQREVHSNSVWIDAFTDLWWVVKPPPPLPHDPPGDGR